MKRLLVTLVIMALLALPSFALEQPMAAEIEQPKTLQDLIELARNNDLQLKIDALSIEKMQIDQFEAHYKAAQISYSDGNAAEALKAYQINTVAPQQADNALKYQKMAELKQYDRLAVQVEDGLASFYIAQRTLEVATAKVELLESQAEATALKVELGTAIALDAIEAENKVTEAKLNLIDLENDLNDAILELKKIVGSDFSLDIDYQITIQSPYREDIAANVDQRVAADLAVIKAQDAYAVQQGLTALIGEQYRETVREYKQGNLDLMIAENKRDDALSDARIDIVAGYDKLQALYKNYQVADTIRQLTLKQHANNQKKLDLGVISKLDLAASSQTLAERELDVLRAIDNYNKAERNYLLNAKSYEVDITPIEIDLNDIYYR